MEKTYEEIVLKTDADSGSSWDVNGVRVGKYKLTFLTKSYRTQVTFQKRKMGRQFLEITMKFPKVKKCDMGHEHFVGHEEKYEFLSIDWEHIDQLIEWLNHGSFSVVKNGH
jgi:hypothetical protein